VVVPAPEGAHEPPARAALSTFVPPASLMKPVTLFLDFIGRMSVMASSPSQ
jgi:hypothetical protein